MQPALAICALLGLAITDATVFFKEQFLDGGTCCMTEVVRFCGGKLARS